MFVGLISWFVFATSTFAKYSASPGPEAPNGMKRGDPRSSYFG